MKAVSAAFKTAWAQKHGRKEILKILYKRRYWNGAAFVYESNFTTLDQNVIPPVRKINWKLDTQNLNEMLASNVTLSFDDRDRKWLPTGAIFQADGVATVGYIPLKMKFQIQFGYILADGTKEYTAMFTGLAEDYRFDGGDHTVEITVSGNERLLKDADAENVMTAFTLESGTPATGDGVVTEFKTTAVGVGRITVVQVGGVTKTEGTDYTLSDMNAVGAAKITFKSTAIPAAAATVKSTGEKWKADQTIETLIGLLCDEAGIGASERTINAVIIPGSVAGSKTFDTQAEWQTGVGGDTITFPGDVQRVWRKIDDFSNTDLNTTPAWTQVNMAATVIGGELHIDSSVIPIAANFSTITTPIPASATGTWEWKLRQNGLAARATDIYVQVGGYWLFYRTPEGDGVGRILTPDLTVVGASTFTLTGTAKNTFRFSRSDAGVMKLYINNILVLTETNNSYGAANPFQIQLVSLPGYTTDIDFDDIYYSSMVDAPAASDAAETWVSAVHNILSVPVSWGTLDRTETLNSGTIAYATSSSTDGITFDAYVAISGGVIQSALKQYFTVRATFAAVGNMDTSPVLSKLVANFATATVALAIANFSSKTCYTAIQRLAQLADYEWGFDGAGLFFFRSKTVSGAAVISLTQETAIAKLSDWRSGYDRIINRGRVRYGDAIGEVYVKEYGSSDAGEASPTSEQSYGTRLHEEDMSDILLANDSNFGTARARLLRDNNYLPKRRFMALCRGIPHLDLADIANITYADRPRDISPMFGDPLQPWGDSSFGPSTVLLANGLNMKVMGISFSFPSSDGAGVTSDLELVEVL